MDPVERQVTLSADVDVVWRLVTNPEELRTWMGDEVDLDPTPGAPGRVVERDGAQRALVVDDVEPGRRLSWRWWPEGADPVRTASRVEITLTPSIAGTVVRVREWPSATGSAGVARAGTGEAWSHRLLHLEALLLVAAAVRG